MSLLWPQRSNFMRPTITSGRRVKKSETQRSRKWETLKDENWGRDGEVREWRQRKGTKVQRWWRRAKWQTKYSKRWKKRRWIQGPEDKETLFFHQTASRIYAYIQKKTFPSRTLTHLPSLHRRWAERKCHELAQTLTNMALSVSRSPLGFLPRLCAGAARSELLHAVATGQLHGKPRGANRACKSPSCGRRAAAHNLLRRAD